MRSVIHQRTPFVDVGVAQVGWVWEASQECAIVWGKHAVLQVTGKARLPLTLVGFQGIGDGVHNQV